jgi:hypothetical protein
VEAAKVPAIGLGAVLIRRRLPASIRGVPGVMRREHEGLRGADTP